MTQMTETLHFAGFFFSIFHTAFLKYVFTTNCALNIMLDFLNTLRKIFCKKIARQRIKKIKDHNKICSFSNFENTTPVSVIKLNHEEICVIALYLHLH